MFASQVSHTHSAPVHIYRMRCTTWEKLEAVQKFIVSGNLYTIADFRAKCIMYHTVTTPVHYRMRHTREKLEVFLQFLVEFVYSN